MAWKGSGVRVPYSPPDRGDRFWDPPSVSAIIRHLCLAAGNEPERERRVLVVVQTTLGALFRITSLGRQRTERRVLVVRRISLGARDPCAEPRHKSVCAVNLCSWSCSPISENRPAIRLPAKRDTELCVRP